MMPGSNNIFFGQSVVDGKPKFSESIKGDAATVSLNTILKDTDGESVLRKTKITFFLVQQSGAWAVKDVQREEISFGGKKPFVYNLLEGLREDMKLAK